MSSYGQLDYIDKKYSRANKTYSIIFLILWYLITFINHTVMTSTLPLDYALAKLEIQELFANIRYWDLYRGELLIAYLIKFISSLSFIIDH